MLFGCIHKSCIEVSSYITMCAHQLVCAWVCTYHHVCMSVHVLVYVCVSVPGGHCAGRAVVRVYSVGQQMVG